MEPHGLILPHGGYCNLLAYRKADIVYGISFLFCQMFLTKSARTVDQKIQAAFSGKQNLSEASALSGASKEADIKLVNTARSSLEELPEDYEDYLCVRELRIWDKNDKEAVFVRALGRKSKLTYEEFRQFGETRSDDVVANIDICLTHRVNYLLDRLEQQLEQDFFHQGGLRERMSCARLAARN